jgi:hypothetical protein
MARIAAEAVLGLHFLWVLFMLLGFPLALKLKSRGLRLVHGVGLLSYLILGIGSWYCPLTLAEEALRRTAQPGFNYHGSFLFSWLSRLIYVQSIPLWIFQVLAAAYLAVIVSSWFWWKPGKIRRERF